MSTITTLLDTPKKVSLQSQSINLRATLKDFERCFTEQHGRKPKQTDIKNDLIIATKYKEYQRVQDVLAGKIAFEKLNDVKPKQHRRSKSRPDSGIGSSPRKDLSTPRKSIKTKTVGVEHNNEEEVEAFQPVLLNAIGPTPHRDGKVLGIFDLISRSGSTTTPSTARKRKMDELFEDTPAKRAPLAHIQTPGGHTRRVAKHEGDLLDFLSGTPMKQQQRQAASGGRYSRTPQSEGKKFQLSQFFATPETARILFQVPERPETDVQATTAGKAVANETPRKELDTTGLDATPTYLRRSTSFKDRLLSASMAPGASLANESRRSSGTRGPPTLRSFRSSTSNVLKDSDLNPVQNKKPQPHRYVEDDDEGDFDDELDALRELEAEESGQNRPPKILVEDSQFDVDGDAEALIDVLDNDPVKPYKKKGQKRTTKRVNIRPMTQATKSTVEPKFVAADGTFSDEEDEFLEEDEEPEPEAESSETPKKGKKGRKQAGMINPNAQSHTNYKTLKIRGKSKAGGKTGGGRKFGRRK